MKGDKWTKKEKAVGRRAFENAYRKECRAIINKIREIANDASEPDDIWRLCDFLDEKREEIGIKYDYRYSVLILVFARLLKEGWITVGDLEGLKEDKIERIRHLGTALAEGPGNESMKT
jgi:hypothetical protein